MQLTFLSENSQPNTLSGQRNTPKEPKFLQLEKRCSHSFIREKIITLRKSAKGPNYPLKAKLYPV